MLQWSEFPILKRAKCRKPLLSVVARWPQTKSWNSCLLELLHIKSSGEGWSLSTRYQNLPVGRYYEGFLEINKTKTLCSRSRLRSEWTTSVRATCLQKDCSELVGIGCCRFSPVRGGGGTSYNCLCGRLRPIGAPFLGSIYIKGREFTNWS